MAGIMHKIEETLHIGGGKKEGDQQKAGQHCDNKAEQHGYDQHKPEHKEGFTGKIKDKVHGDQHDKGEKKNKKKKEKKKDEHGKEQSSSDSD